MLRSLHRCQQWIDHLGSAASRSSGSRHDRPGFLDRLSCPLLGAMCPHQRAGGRCYHGGVVQTITRMPDEFHVTCPYCGEEVDIYVEPDVMGTFVQDCEVCCNPWRVRVMGRDEHRAVEVTRADGSE